MTINLPPHVAHIWADGAKIHLTFPGAEGAHSPRFNTVTLNPSDHPKCKCGNHVPSPVLTVLFEILRARARAEGPAERKIASPATLTVAQLEEGLRKTKARLKAAQTAKATERARESEVMRLLATLDPDALLQELMK